MMGGFAFLGSVGINRAAVAVCASAAVLAWIGFLFHNLIASLTLPYRLFAFPLLLLSLLCFGVGLIIFFGIKYRWLFVDWLPVNRLSKHRIILATLLLGLGITVFYPDSDTAKSQAAGKIGYQRNVLLSIANTPGACYSSGELCVFPDVPELINQSRRGDFYSDMNLLSVMRGKQCLIYSVGRDGVSQNGVEASVPDTEVGIDGLEAMVPSRFWKKVCEAVLPEDCRVVPGDIAVALPECLQEQ